MRVIERLLSLGHDAATSERMARHIRISNALALIGALVATVSFPFDVVTAPPWFWLTDVIGFVAFATGWRLNATGHITVSRVLVLAAANLVIAYSTYVLGEGSRQATVFFALATAPFFAFDLDEPQLLVPMVALPIACYFVCQQLAPTVIPHYSVSAYRVYSPIVAFAGVALANIAAARTNRRAEDALGEARARAVASARLAALGEMASGIAHEIRNPLAAISIASEQLAECKRLDDVPKLAAQTKRITTRISKIIDGLTSFSRDTSAEPLQVVGVDTIVADTLELCQRRFAAHHIQLTSKVAAASPVECRPVQISQILLNLLNNAHDAAESAAEHWVRLDVEQDATHVMVSVTDSGAGVPDGLRARIFEPFFTTKGPRKGTGLGLSVSRAIAEAHHGTLEQDDRAPHTRFVLRIPLRQPAGG